MSAATWCTPEYLCLTEKPAVDKPPFAASTSQRRFWPAPPFSALRSTFLWLGSASAVSNLLRGTDLSGWEFGLLEHRSLV